MKNPELIGEREFEMDCLKHKPDKIKVPIRLYNVDGELKMHSYGCDNADASPLCEKCIDAAYKKANSENQK